MRIRMIEICSSHGGTDYTDSDLFIPIPPSALRAVYAHVVNCCCFPEDKSFRNLTLETGRMNLHDRNAYEKDLRLFYEKPLAYEWEFRIWNSY